MKWKVWPRMTLRRTYDHVESQTLIFRRESAINQQSIYYEESKLYWSKLYSLKLCTWKLTCSPAKIAQQTQLARRQDCRATKIAQGLRLPCPEEWESCRLKVILKEERGNRDGSLFCNKTYTASCIELRNEIE